MIIKWSFQLQHSLHIYHSFLCWHALHSLPFLYLSIIHIIDVDPWVPIFFPVGYISLPFLIIWHANCSDFANKSPTLAPYEMLTGSDIYIVFPLLFFRNSVISLCSSPFTQVLFNVRFLNFQVGGLGFFLVSFLISSFIAEIRVLVTISIMKPTDVLCPNILVFVKVPCAFEKKVQTLLSKQCLR